VAKLSPVKGHRHFLEAAASVSRAYGDVRFLVVGDGPERARLERTAGELGISGKVRFLGVRDDVPAVLKLMDVLVLSSLSEGSPNVVLEGMASGVPIVGTRVGGVPELVEDGVSGLLVDPGDVPAMSNAVLALLTDPDRARAMGEKGRTRATEDYDINRVIVRIEDVFSDLLKRARGRRGHASEERDGGGV
jgi:glycosyltransferase involved in cell wall biosynthesis